MVQHTFGQWKRCKTCTLGLLKMPQNLIVLLQCLITQGNLLSDSQNYLPLVSQSQCRTEVLHLFQAELPAHSMEEEWAGCLGYHPSLWKVSHHHIRGGDCLVFGGTGALLVPDLCQVALLHNAQGFCYNA